ncbi:MAG: hypothetical protein B6I20_05690 [Bacteroidetes bacterium 4572_117]|nr:MAG: hypothetical protein B6I20_05690 [Bacteroidetes bacterium 4572_117]
MKDSIILIIWILFSISSYSQSSYGDYSNSDKQNVFYDNFNSNQNYWPQDNDNNQRFSISNGYYTLRAKNGATKIVTKQIPFDNSKNFEIETRMKIIEDDSRYHGHTLRWGANTNNKFDFAITLNHKYVITKYDASKPKGSKNKFIVENYSNYFNKGGYNTLTIRKVNNYYYFFLNKKFIYKMPFENFYGNRIGYKCSGLGTLSVDYLRVSYLEKNTYNSPPSISINEPNISRGFKVVQVKMLRVAGKATDTDGIYEVTANGFDAKLQSGGYFSVNVPLSTGNNTITVKATDTKMKSATKTFEVNRKSENVSNNFSTNEKRVALVFGNSNYSKVANLGVNPILASMNTAIREFGRQNRDADVALFYFAGHGMQVEKVNYLVPVGVNINDKNDVSFECVSVNTVQKIMETSNSNRLNLIVLDACRNNPYRTWQRGGESGLSNMTPPSGTLIAFATSPGSTASNGNNRNGLYTGELIKQLRIPQRIEDVFINTRVQVETKSGGSQSPWELARLRGIFYLKK